MRENFSLSRIGSVEDIIVFGQRRPQELTAGTVLDRDRIDTVTSIGRDVRDLLRRDPLATQNNGGNRGISIAGQLPQANQLTIDGVSAKDDFGINTGGLPTTRGPVSLDAIEQISIKAAPFDVEEGNFLGGAINIVLKSGSNAFEGSVFYETNRDFLAGDSVRGREIVTPFEGETFGGVLTGPILRDRLFFSGSYEEYTRTSATMTGPSGATPAFATERNITQAQFDSVGALVRDLYDYEPLGLPASAEVLDRKWHARLDLNITDKHRAQFTYRSARDSGISRPSPAGVANSLPDASYWYTLGQVDSSYTGQINSDWTSAFSTEFRITKRDYDRTQDPLGPNDAAGGTAESDALEFPEVLVCFDATSVGAVTACTNNVVTLAYGPDRFRHANILGTSTLGLRFRGQYLIGTHSIKFGLERQANEDSNLIVPNSEGIYYFDSVADFQAGQANQFTYSNSLDGVAQNAAADFNFEINTAYLQDSWDITDWLSASLGLRYDFYTSDSGPQRSQPFVTRYAAQGLVNDTFIDGRDVLQPRFAFEARPDDNTRISGGVGLFSTLISDVLALSSSVANDGVRTNTVQITRNGTGFTLNQGTPSLFNPGIGASALNVFGRSTPFDLFAIPTDVQTLLAGGGAPASASTVSISEDFEVPSNWKADLAVSRSFDLGWLGTDWRLGFNFLYQRTENTYDLTELRLLPNGVLPDGRPRYIGDNNLTPQLDRALTGVGDAGFDLVVNNTSQGDARAYTWTASKAYPNLDVNLSYTRQDVNSVIDGQVGGTTAQSQYSGTAVRDPNRAEFGTSVQEVKDSFKYEFTYRRKFFGDLQTSLTLFGETRSGRPYSFTFGDQAATGNTQRSPVFGTLGSSRFLFFVPDFAGDADTSDLRVGSVFFSDQTQLGLVRDFVLSGPLAAYQGQISPRNAFRGPIVNRLDLQFRQELPSIRGQKAEIYFGIDNFLNLLSDEWGVLEEFGSQVRVVNVACAGTTGIVNAAANVACPAYSYSGANINPLATNTDANTPSLDLGASRWTAQLGIRYKF